VINTIADVENLLKAQDTSAYNRDQLDLFLTQYPLDYACPSIHITGTNGKGSTANFLAAIYRTTYPRVGLFTSPSLTNFQAMITIDGNVIEDDFVITFFQTWEARFRLYKLSPFEMQTLCMFAYFQFKQCGIAIIEVGMGGKVDATNIFTPLVSVITSITLEHQMYLGHSTSAIAEHKGGIIKPGRPVIIGDVDTDARNVLIQIATRHHAPLVYPEKINITQTQPLTFNLGKRRGIRLNMVADYQVNNAALALTTYDTLQDQFPVAEDKLLHALQTMAMPGRFEVVKQNPTVILDVGHNPGAIAKLIDVSFWKHTPPTHILFAAFADKDIPTMLTMLSRFHVPIIITSFAHPRAQKLSSFLGDYPRLEHWQDVFKQQQFPITQDSVLLITGSMAFISLIRKEMVP